jgi:hypothetical protein
MLSELVIVLGASSQRDVLAPPACEKDLPGAMRWTTAGRGRPRPGELR